MDANTDTTRSDPKLVRTDEDFRTAVYRWVTPQLRVGALEEYVHISDWDTLHVTNCTECFKHKYWDLNDDIFRWDMSNITSMRRVQHLYEFQSTYW